MIRTNYSPKNKSNKSKPTEQFAFLFADRLKKARMHKNLTQEHVAELINVDTRTYQNYEYKKVPNFEVITKLSQILDCDITYLNGGNDENVFKKDISSASETTGLKYETIETLQEIKNSKHKDTENYIDKCILFLLDFLLQRVNGRGILHSMFNYLFKNFSKCYTDTPDTPTTSIILTDNSNISINNIEIDTNEFSEEYFYSKTIRSIVKFKEEEKTVDVDTSKCVYPLTNELYNERQNIALDKLKSEYKNYIPFDKEKVCKELLRTSHDDPNIVKLLAAIITMDTEHNNTIKKINSFLEKNEYEYKESKKYK